MIFERGSLQLVHRTRHESCSDWDDDLKFELINNMGGWGSFIFGGAFRFVGWGWISLLKLMLLQK
jgi:hypothetical protein